MTLLSPTTPFRASASVMPRLADRRQPLLLHISGDYPDPIRNRTTYAVKNLIDLLDDCDHVIVSLKRRSNPAQCYFEECSEAGGPRVFALGYWAPPAGILHRVTMRLLAEQIRGLVEGLESKPDLVMAHKLTIEGVVALHLHRMLGLPYVCSVRGEVEDKLFRFKPELRRLFGEVVAGADALFYVSAWFRDRIAQRYPHMVRREYLLPNFSGRSIRPRHGARDPHTLLTVLDLNMYRRKGFHHLIAAFAEAQKTMPQLRLDVIGWASAKTAAHLQKRVTCAGIADSVHFLGAMSHDDVLEAMPRYGALVLPARNETFGMVYVEALRSGTPILYTADSGVDGYLDGLDVGVRVNVGDIAGIAKGLLTLATEGDVFRNALLRQHEAVQARFAPAPYLAHVRGLVADIVARRAVSP